MIQKPVAVDHYLFWGIRESKETRIWHPKICHFGMMIILKLLKRQLVEEDSDPPLSPRNQVIHLPHEDTLGVPGQSPQRL